MLMREARPEDAAAIIDNLVTGIESYREWAPASWVPPGTGPEPVERLRARLADSDVWCLVALDGPELAGHVSLSPVTGENPEPAPPGMTNVWQMFVRRPWQGRGVARQLMAAAVAEAGRRGYRRLRLWTPEGAAQARRFYEREGWAHTGAVRYDSPFGLPLVEYQREIPPQPPS
jgi:GNAT superfamily N-acetyltransferase